MQKYPSENASRPGGSKTVRWKVAGSNPPSTQQSLNIRSGLSGDNKPTNSCLQLDRTHQPKPADYYRSADLHTSSPPCRSSPHHRVGNNKPCSRDIENKSHSILRTTLEKPATPINSKPHVNPCASHTPMRTAETMRKDEDSKSAKVSPIADLSGEINAILFALVVLFKNFKFPTKLDFFPNANNPLLLPDNDVNQLFISQLRKIDGLRTKLAGIPIHNDERLKEQQRLVGLAIGRALRKMKQHQLILYEKYKNDRNPLVVLDELLVNLNNCVTKFEYPSELEFSSKAENTVTLSAKNATFNRQLGLLGWFRDELSRIPTYDDELVGQKHRDISVAIGRALQMLKEHQRRLYDRHMKAHQPHRI